MKTRIGIIARGETGKILVMALVLLVLGALLLTPLLGLMSTGLTAGQVYERKTAELYAADAGVEDAINWLLHGRPQDWDWTWDEVGLIGSRSSPIHINDKSVMVTLEGLLKPNFFKITSTAASSSGGSTTVVSTVWAIPKFTGCYEEDGLRLGTNDEMTIEGDLYVDGDVTLVNHSELVVKGGVTIEGDLILENNTSFTADVICVTGDIELANNTEINAHIHFLGDNNTITIDNPQSHVVGNIWAEGNLTIRIETGSAAVEIYCPDGIYARANVYIYLEKKESKLVGDVFAGGEITIGAGHKDASYDSCLYQPDEKGVLWVSDDGCLPQQDPPFVIPPCPVMTTNPVVTYTYEIT